MLKQTKLDVEKEREKEPASVSVDLEKLGVRVYMWKGTPTVVCRKGHHGQKTCRFFNCTEPEERYYKELLESI